MIDHKLFQAYNLKGELVSVSELNDVEELRELLCREMNSTETFIEQSTVAIDWLKDAHEKWLADPKRGRK